MLSKINCRMVDTLGNRRITHLTIRITLLSTHPLRYCLRYKSKPMHYIAAYRFVVLLSSSHKSFNQTFCFTIIHCNCLSALPVYYFLFICCQNFFISARKHPTGCSLFESISGIPFAVPLNHLCIRKRLINTLPNLLLMFRLFQRAENHVLYSVAPIINCVLGFKVIIASVKSGIVPIGIENDLEELQVIFTAQ